MVCTGTGLPSLHFKSDIFLNTVPERGMVFRLKFALMEERKCSCKCIIVTDQVRTHESCSTAGQHTCFISPEYEVF
jgi:hypothetical protein